ncbi:MAG: RecQ family zinc-binding domain-containing protein [Longimicrobiales bacterium]
MRWDRLARARRREERRLEAVIGYTTSPRCRRAFLLRYFGERPPERCTGCDRCDPRAPRH